ncbi:ferredoxin:oxidoreductase FAD/NAD(P)-binding subunit [Marinobacterium nitratireducens]|uniref:Ferredoxin:oxidoreductase FAD/NAD(P)-binding subunit n=1 Tax=Marinobacterium nitratireducens TaxID=518897 RepID=A0A918DX77_9GAMM|nr:PDR/VanB family oxidoreductase [Marinobacterium nitratireducens]GGO86545.1 ferredoxin:oxidoreductase FAD/NAD(P)-binding subunit [Marinobacterium nitratireducens]
MIEVEVISKTLDAEDIFRFELARPDGAALPVFGAGAHIDVHLPNGLVRQYSLCNHPEESHRYEIGVLKDPASRGGSQAMHEQVQAGDRLQISEPRNHFPLAHEAKRSLLFAGGIGVTPILCMAERLAHGGGEFDMHYCTRSESRTAFRQRIATSEFAERVQFHFDDGDEAQKLDAASLLANPEAGTHIYVCGPKGFMDHVLETAERLGWPAEQVHREYFAAAPINHDADAAFEIQLSSSGQVLEVPADKSALQVLLEQDIDIPYSCEDGVCGTCLTRVLEGEPDHRDLFMEPAEHAANDQFTPCCSRSKSKRLVLDI